jgi:hypothetical protein
MTQNSKQHAGQNAVPIKLKSINYSQVVFWSHSPWINLVRKLRDRSMGPIDALTTGEKRKG